MDSSEKSFDSMRNIAMQVPSSPRKTDKASISQLLNSAPIQQKPMLQVSMNHAGENDISPRSILGLEGLDPNVMGLPERGYSLGYGSVNLQPTLKPAYFAASHLPLTSTYFNYAGQYPNQAVLHTHVHDANVGTVQLPRAPNYAHFPLHQRSDTYPMISPPPTQNLGLQSPLELQQKQTPHFVPFYTSAHSISHTHSNSFSSAVGTADGPHMQPGVHMQNVTNSAIQNGFVLGLPAQMPSRVSSDAINYGSQVMPIASTPFYYGPKNEPIQSELIPSQFPHGCMIGFAFQGQKSRRFRRRYHQIHRKYKCPHEECTKSYGSLNHLNTHIVTKKHGQRLSKAEFKRLYENERTLCVKSQESAVSDNACLSQDESESGCSGEDDKSSAADRK